MKCMVSIIMSLLFGDWISRVWIGVRLPLWREGQCCADDGGSWT